MDFIRSAAVSFQTQFTATFITDQRYLLFLNGLKTTLIITVGAALMGIVLGFIIAYIRTTHDRIGKLGLFKLALQALPYRYPRYAVHDTVAYHVLCHLWLCQDR